MPTFSSDALTNWIAEIFQACAVPRDAALVVAEHLVDAEACGVSSHGVIRVPQYLRAIAEKRVIPDARLTVVREHAATAVLDGGHGFGQVMARAAMDVAIERAKQAGVGAVTLRNCGHTGRLGSYPEQATRAGMAGLIMSNTGGNGQWVAPFGGLAGRLSTNPISIAVPSESGNPLLMDFATSIAPEGRVRTLQVAGRPLPPGWIVNHRGEPSTNPDDLYGPPRGAILPLGGHKGFGLAMLVDALAGGLSGAGCCVSTDQPMDGKTDGAFLLAIHVEDFCPPAEFRSAVARLMAHVKSSPPAPGVAEVVVPGELEFRTRAERLQSGIPVADATWDLLRESARRAGVAEL
ncbi:MAG: Ldh family oxidoreductase [Planctomycetia bacterium]|nr:Ldh family oxidoreductase [Planctomycetia bacterium]